VNRKSTFVKLFVKKDAVFAFGAKNVKRRPSSSLGDTPAVTAQSNHWPAHRDAETETEGGLDNMQHNFDEIIERRGTDSKKWSLYAPDVIPMWIADTDFRCPQPVIDAVVKRAEHGIYGYPGPSKGFELSVQHWEKTRFGWDIDPAWVEFTPAVVPALVYAVKAFTHPGDKVLIQTPVYHPFHHIIVNNGRYRAENELIYENGTYRIDFEDLEDKLSDPRTRLMLLCHPHNPVGKAFTREELLRIGELCLKHHVIVFSDEIHSDLVFWGRKHIPFASLSEAFQNNCLVSVNPSKTFNIAGTRTAAIITPNKELREAFKISVVNCKGDGRTVFGTLPFEVCYNECAYYADQLVAYLQDNILFLGDYLEKHVKGVKMVKPEATYLIWLDCQELNLPQPELNALFLEKAKVGLSDGESFGRTGKGFMRINVACPRSVLKEALERIRAAVATLG
jgi:cystathionine beta-lyase